MKDDQFKDTPKALGEAIGFNPDKLNDLSAYKRTHFDGPVGEPKRTPEECVDILLDAGFTHTQIKALNKVGAIRP